MNNYPHDYISGNATLNPTNDVKPKDLVLKLNERGFSPTPKVGLGYYAKIVECSDCPPLKLILRGVDGNKQNADYQALLAASNRIIAAIESSGRSLSSDPAERDRQINDFLDDKLPEVVERELGGLLACVGVEKIDRSSITI